MSKGTIPGINFFFWNERRVILKLNYFWVGGWCDKKNKFFFGRNKEKNKLFLANWNAFVERVTFNVYKD